MDLAHLIPAVPLQQGFASCRSVVLRRPSWAPVRFTATPPGRQIDSCGNICNVKTYRRTPSPIHRSDLPPEGLFFSPRELNRFLRTVSTTQGTKDVRCALVCR